MSESANPLLQSQFEHNNYEEQSDQPFFSRCATALNLGGLPDNMQLYALLHALATFLDTISDKISPSSHSHHVTDKYMLSLAALGKETSSLTRLLASWLQGSARGASGNGNEQIQRFLWHLLNSIVSDTDSVDVRMESNKANSTIHASRKAANAALHDVRSATQSLLYILSTILASDQ